MASANRVRELLVSIERIIRENRQHELEAVLAKLEVHDLAKIVSLSRYRFKIFDLLSSVDQAKVLALLPPRLKKKMVGNLSFDRLRAILSLVDQDDAEEIMQHLDPARKEKLKMLRDREQETEVREVLQFAPETAGQLMSTNFVVVDQDFKVEDVGKKVEGFVHRHQDAPVIIAVDKENQVLGRIYIALLINASKETRVVDLIRKVPVVKPHTDQEDVVKSLRDFPKEDLVIATDEEGHPIGVIHAKDLIKVVEQEATEDIYGFAGVYEEEKAIEPVQVAVKRRYRWLVLNLMTAFLAAAVVSLFEDTLAKMVILAAYMPVIAGMGGNAGTQTLAVVVRGIAVGEISAGQGRRVLLKEVATGILDGLIVGAIVAVVATLLNQNPMLGLILGASMIVNLMTAGFFGTVIPLMLKKLNIDPAISSSIFLTTMTDVIGFFTFLGLATIFLI